MMERIEENNGQNIIQGLLKQHNIELAGDIQERLKELLGVTIKEMIVPEMEENRR